MDAIIKIIIDGFTIFFILVGSFFLFVGSVGLVRMPDVYCRMHSASKSTTMGICSLFLATFTHLGTKEVGLKSFLAIVFILITTPIGTHMIAKAAYMRGVSLSKTSGEDLIDEMPDHRKPDKIELKDLD